MPLLVAARLGPYEVLGPLGAGGMGEVYRARDTRLDRTVALKVLRPEFAQTPERHARFEREARAVSALNHPHICALYDVGQHDGIDYLILEYIEGETLAERLKRGPLALDQVLRYAIEIADALDKAHRHGIVHRDLKPSNVMLAKAGAKLLDFGLAKLKTADAKPASALLSELQTLENPGAGPLTAEGRILGTFHYMAPEQVEGKEADARTDIFALGALAYEMTTGKRAFDGKSPASLVAAILERDPPPLAALQPMTPAALDRLVRKCLAKDPEDRWQSVADVVTELKWVPESPPVSSATTPRGKRAWLPWLAVVPLALVGATVLARYLAHEPKPRARVVSSILPPEGVVSAFQRGVALSPGSKQLAFTAVSREGRELLWLRSMESGEARPIAETDDAQGPFWSPDGRFIGFFARGKLKKVAAAGGSPQTLCAFGGVLPAVGGWTRRDVIVFYGQQAPGILQVSASGGTPIEATHLDSARGEVRHWLPQLLPDGDHLIYHVRGREPGVYLGALQGGPGRLLLPTRLGTASAAFFADPGYLLLYREEALVAQRLEPDGSRLQSEAITVARDLETPIVGIVVLSTAGADLAYVSRRSPPRPIHLLWRDRAGKSLGPFDDLVAAQGFRLSSDGRRLAVNGQPTADSEWGLWVYDRIGAAPRRIGPAIAGPIAWSPDGRRVLHRELIEGRFRAVLSSVTGAAPEEILFDTPESLTDFPCDWSSDGRVVLVRKITGSTRGDDIWLVSADTHEGRGLVEGDTDETNAVISPDGRWLAYVSGEAGPPNVYVRNIDGEGSPDRISTEGGSFPHWRRDGGELFYLGLNGDVMAVPVRSHPTLETGAATRLFHLAIPALSPGLSVYPYDVSPDGQRFLVAVSERETPVLTYIQNWAEGLPPRE